MASVVKTKVGSDNTGCEEQGKDPDLFLRVSHWDHKRKVIFVISSNGRANQAQQSARRCNS